MAYEHRDGQGSMFRNEKQNERQPDYRGTIVINGTTYEIAGWERTSKRGSSYISLQASLPRERDGQDARPHQQYQPHSNYMQPAPPIIQPAPEAAPMPSVEDMPAFGPEDNFPF